MLFFQRKTFLDHPVKKATQIKRASFSYQKSNDPFLYLQKTKNPASFFNLLTTLLKSPKGDFNIELDFQLSQIFSSVFAE